MHAFVIKNQSDINLLPLVALLHMGPIQIQHREAYCMVALWRRCPSPRWMWIQHIHTRLHVHKIQIIHQARTPLFHCVYTLAQKSGRSIQQVQHINKIIHFMTHTANPDQKFLYSVQVNTTVELHQLHTSLWVMHGFRRLKRFMTTGVLT